MRIYFSYSLRVTFSPLSFFPLRIFLHLIQQAWLFSPAYLAVHVRVCNKKKKIMKHSETKLNTIFLVLFIPFDSNGSFNWYISLKTSTRNWRLRNALNVKTMLFAFALLINERQIISSLAVNQI